MFANFVRYAKRFARDEDGAYLVEFGITFPVLILLSCGLLEFSLIAFEYQRAAEATRRGVRLAIIQEPIPNTANLLIDNIITCVAPLGTVTCTGGSPSANADALFTALFNEMQAAYPPLTMGDIVVTFEGTDVGSAGDIGGIFPLVTLQMTGVQHTLFFGHIIGIESIEFPDFKATVLGNGKWVNTA